MARRPAKRATRSSPKKKALKALDSGFEHMDSLALNETPHLDEYIRAVSEYVRNQKAMSSSTAKRAQISLSKSLGRILQHELDERLTSPPGKPKPKIKAGEVTVAGALRNVRADVSESHELDGLRLAVEIKPVNVAVGRALWNRFGDIRAFAVNIHLKFPFAVVAGVLSVPTWEWDERKTGSAGSADDQSSDLVDEVAEASDDAEEFLADSEAIGEIAEAAEQGKELVKQPTTELIKRVIDRLQRARPREIEADPPHLLEAVTLLVYNPDTAELVEDLPTEGYGLRWPEFIEQIVRIYRLRF